MQVYLGVEKGCVCVWYPELSQVCQQQKVYGGHESKIEGWFIKNTALPVYRRYHFYRKL